MVFKRFFRDNNQYGDYTDHPYIEYLALTVKNFLYDTTTNGVELSGLCLRGKIELYDFMSIAVHFIVPSLSPFGDLTIDEWLREMNNYHETSDIFGIDIVRYASSNIDISDYVYINSASPRTQVCLLWTACIYAAVQFKTTKKTVWKTATVRLRDLICNYWRAGFGEGLGKNLLLRNEEAAVSRMLDLIRDYGADSEEESVQQMANTKACNEQIAGLEATIKELKQQIAERNNKPVTKTIRIRKEFQSKMSQFLHLAWKKKMFVDEDGSCVTQKEVNSAFTDFLGFDFNAWSGNLSTLYKGGNWEGLENDISDVLDTQKSLKDFIKQVSEEEHNKRNP